MTKKMEEIIMKTHKDNYYRYKIKFDNTRREDLYQLLVSNC